MTLDVKRDVKPKQPEAYVEVSCNNLHDYVSTNVNLLNNLLTSEKDLYDYKKMIVSLSYSIENIIKQKH